jgi:hypothetical protein
MDVKSAVVVDQPGEFKGRGGGDSPDEYGL